MQAIAIAIAVAPTVALSLPQSPTMAEPAATLAQTGCMLNAPSVFFFFFAFCSLLLLVLLTAALELDAPQRGSYIDSLSAWHCFYERLQLLELKLGLQLQLKLLCVIRCNHFETSKQQQQQQQQRVAASSQSASSIVLRDPRQADSVAMPLFCHYIDINFSRCGCCC